MNLPNKLTLARVIMIPLFVVFLLADFGWGCEKWIALGLFAAASATDFLDGYIARKNNLITTFGKFMDPLADKLLVTSAMICLTGLGILPAWVSIIIIAREFTISGFRLVAADHRVVIAASMWGKWKTFIQMIMVMLMIVNLPELEIVTQIFMWASIALTLISLADYLIKNREAFWVGDAKE